MIERVVLNGVVLAIILRHSFEKEGIEFFTENDFSQQLGYMNRPAGYVIAPHKHRDVKREVIQTQEVLFIKSGKVKVDLYSDERVFFQSVILSQGDVILLASGGHGFTMLEQSEIIEVKQGPYSSDNDKIIFK